MAAPIRIGVLNDMSDGPPGPTDIHKWLRLAIDDLVANGRIDRPVELVDAWGLGLPTGTAAAVERAFAELVAADVLMVVGPPVGHDALVATPLAEHHRMPTVNWAGAERARSEYMFHLQVGSHEDESIVIARHLAAIGARHVAVVHDRSPIGLTHLQFLQAEGDIIGVQVTGVASVTPIAEDATSEVGKVLGTQPDALVYFGFGIAAPAVARAATDLGWTGPSIMNTAGLRGYAPDFARAVDGWMYVDMRADDNVTLNALLERLDFPRAQATAAAKGYDLGRLAAEGIARAPDLTREGMKDGLERIKWIPAAEGYEGTILAFGVQDRGALHGRYLVLRRWCDGQSVQV